jgi:hypothetical protein
MKFEEVCQLLTAESKPYNFAGNEGTSHKIRFNVGGEIYVCNSNAQQVSEFKQYEGKKGTAQFVFSSPKETLKMAVTSFEPER